jgi:hypothetical protein
VPLKRNELGIWTIELEEEDKSVLERSHPSYFEALPRYLTALEPAFERARKTSEFNFIFAIVAVREMQDAGWDPYETTVRGIEAIRALSNNVEGEPSRHLALWLYGHIMEASEPYEFLANLIDIGVGGRFGAERFPPHAGGSPLSPQRKIEQLERSARAAGLPDAVVPMKEAWNREFRNSIFHADYSLYGAEVRTMRPIRSYDHNAVMTLVNRALAYHEALSLLRVMNIRSYKCPILIPCDPRFSGKPNERAFVIVREKYGATGLKDAWTEADIRRGEIPYRIGRFTAEETKLLDQNRSLAFLPVSDKK